MFLNLKFNIKGVVLFLFFFGGLLSIKAQQTSNDSINKVHKTLILKLGVNLVDSTGDTNVFGLFSNFDQMAFSDNFNVELEYRFSRWLSLATNWSKNKWEANDGNINGTIIKDNQKYLAIDLDLKFYYDEAFRWLDDKEWLEFYLHSGVGSSYQVNQAGVTLNLGSGANIWFTDKFGVNLNGTRKWIVDGGDNRYNVNHFQYSASLMFKLTNNDFDNDGVKNSSDECPNVIGLVANNGCPEEISDRDGDGVTDVLDQCPDEYGTDNGCPKIVIEADSDGDSVLDSVDDCPQIKGLLTNNGCPLSDSDNDGIVDAKDKCPNVLGLKSNNGCPLKETIVEDTNLLLKKLNPKIVFDTSSYKIKKTCYSVLKQMAIIFNQHPEAVFKIEGHADNVGSEELNNMLSKKRATVVRDYFVNELGISTNSIVIEYYGESIPKASNSTKEGRQTNRRVEISRIK